jgi:predicted nucleotidyltransferase
MDKTVQAELTLLRDIIVNTLPVDQIFLFGSYTYGVPHKDSDLDLYVVLKGSTSHRRSRLAGARNRRTGRR